LIICWTAGASPPRETTARDGSWGEVCPSCARRAGDMGGSVRGGVSFTARITSSRVMRPCSPEPRTSLRSTPCSSAARRVDGAASGLSDLFGSVSTDGGTGSAVFVAILDETLPGCARAGPAFSSSWRMTVRTGTTSPSLASSFMIRPPAGAGSSLSALSVAISAMAWSLTTTSPSLTSHFVIVPSVTLSPS
jgi:hypothetical protein